ncbi:MAG TPA: hypothetical protein ENI56_00420 [Candidatus Kaiserbacteria bacterium]|nr:hypothetical protein [Candidatus Kaiserbacteria bacterium]
MGYGNENSKRLTFESSYMKKNGESKNKKFTTKTIKDTYIELKKDFIKMHRLYLELDYKVFFVDEHRTDDLPQA